MPQWRGGPPCVAAAVVMLLQPGRRDRLREAQRQAIGEARPMGAGGGTGMAEGSNPALGAPPRE